MVRPGRDKLSGWVEVDEAYFGGLEEGKAGRGGTEKTLIVIAAEADGPGIGRVRMSVIDAASVDNLQFFVEASVEPGSTVHTDCWPATEDYRQRATITRSQNPQAEEGGESSAAARAPGCFVSEAWLLGTPSRCRQPPALGVLPGRVYLPLQPKEIQEPREAFLSLGPIGSDDRAGTLSRPRHARQERTGQNTTCWGYLSKVDTQ
jgi:hypothetical protein